MHHTHEQHWDAEVPLSPKLRLVKSLGEWRRIALRVNSPTTPHDVRVSKATSHVPCVWTVQASHKQSEVSMQSSINRSPNDTEADSPVISKSNQHAAR